MNSGNLGCVVHPMVGDYALWQGVRRALKGKSALKICLGGLGHDADTTVEGRKIWSTIERERG